MRGMSLDTVMLDENVHVPTEECDARTRVMNLHETDTMTNSSVAIFSCSDSKNSNPFTLTTSISSSQQCATRNVIDNLHRFRYLSF